jgi:OHCU decarboxylase
MPWTISQLNDLDAVEFVRVIGPVFEHSPWIAEAVWARRPFADGAALHRALCEVVREASLEQQLALIRAHPDLVGRAALAGTLTRESANEQASAGLDRLTPEEIEKLQQDNAAYREKFGFPFVICARRNRKEAILAGFEHRLENSRAHEIQTALDEIFKIAGLRLHDLTDD